MTAFLDPDGIWCEATAPPARFGRGAPALFLDRDGVVVKEVDYLHRPEDVRLISGAAAVMARANRFSVPVVLVTNQAGIGRGYYGWAEFAATQAGICAGLAAQCARWDLVLACPFHPEGVGDYRSADHPCRKPRPGMILRAAQVLPIDLSKSWIVGDRAPDLEAGRAAGLRGGLHVLTGHGAADRKAAEGLAAEGFEVRRGDSIAAAAQLPLLAG